MNLTIEQIRKKIKNLQNIGFLLRQTAFSMSIDRISVVYFNFNNVIVSGVFYNGVQIIKSEYHEEILELMIELNADFDNYKDMTNYFSDVIEQATA